jgi:hypothetical protein
MKLSTAPQIRAFTPLGAVIVKERKPDNPVAGFTLVEVTLGLTLLMIGLLGFIGAMSSTQVMVRVTKERNIANLAIISTIEEFREECAIDFVAAVIAYQNANNLNPDRLLGIGSSANMSSVVVLDENQLTPPLDLDGNGVYVDTLTPAEVNAAVLRVRVTWNGSRGQSEIEYTTIVAKGQN